ncbi:hypothetical protein FPRO03_14121 [Fusarium proliferatum]|nr:hypothetical protein FPRO03_14121 [Fusarium proliferatum]
MSSDTSSIIGATENPPDVNGLPSNFLSIMDIITKGRSNTRGRKTGGKTIYTCTVCGGKRYDHNANAANHVRNNHPVASRSTSSEIKDSLTTASSPIHISTDLWTSPHRHSLLAADIEWIKFNANGRRIRCIAHIINLSLQAFLLASSKEALVAALESASGVTGEELLSQFSEVLTSHRKKAAAERNTAKRKNGEPARKHKRKGSTASNTKKDKIQSFMSDHEEAIRDNRLLVGDWELLGKKIYQSDEHSDERMVRAIDMGWFILSKYYRLTDEVPVYAAALLFDPRKRIAYIKQNWPKEWHKDTIASATAFWRKEFNYEQASDHPSAPTSMPPPLAKKPNQLAILSKKLEVRTINASDRDDFTSFISVDATDIPPDYDLPMYDADRLQKQERGRSFDCVALCYVMYIFRPGGRRPQKVS